MARERRTRSDWRRGGALAAVGIALAGASLQAAEPKRPNLGEARSFAVLAGSTVSSTGLTAVTGDVGVSPGTGMTGFPPGTVADGEIHAADDRAAAAHRDASLAYAHLKGMARVPANELTGVDLGGRTLPPGVYFFTSSAGLTGDLVLDAGGRSDALFVFQIGSSLVTAPGSSVTVINGGGGYDESNVYWQVGSSATLDAGTAFLGNILAYSSISMESGATMIGNALALNGAVTMVSDTVTSAPNARDRRVRHPSRGKTKMTPPDGALDGKPRAVVKVKYASETRRRVEQSSLKISGRRLEKRTGYTLWADDPSTPEVDPVQIDTITTNRGGAFHYRKDTRKGDALPFGATLSNLSGVTIEVRDAVGASTLLAGVIPTTSP